MKIKITAGVFGYRDGKFVRPVRPGDEPIEVAKETAERLIKSGVAVLVEDQPATEKTVEVEKDEGLDFPEYSEKMTRAELEAVAREVGVEEDEIKAAENKAQLIELIDEVKAEFEADEAPSFDRAGETL